MSPILLWKFWPLLSLFALWGLFRISAHYWAVPWILRSLKAKIILPNANWDHVMERAAVLARKYRLPQPMLYVLPEFSPNAMALRGSHGSLHLAVTEGLLQVLSQKEIDAALTLLLAQASFRDCARAVRVSWYMRPFCLVIDEMPEIFWAFLSPFLSLVARFSLSPTRILRSDRRAARWQQSTELSGTLQKILALSRKVPIRRWNLAFDHLYLIPPLQMETVGLPFIATHPPLEIRLRRLLDLGLKV